MSCLLFLFAELSSKLARMARFFDSVTILRSLSPAGRSNDSNARIARGVMTWLQSDFNEKSALKDLLRTRWQVPGRLTRAGAVFQSARACHQKLTFLRREPKCLFDNYSWYYERKISAWHG